MGLDCYIQAFDKKTNKYTDPLPKAIVDKFANLDFIVNITKCYEYPDYHCVSFRGKVYEYAVNSISKKKYSLYLDLYPEQMENLIKYFDNFLSKFNKNEIELFQKAYDVNIIDCWQTGLIKEHIPSPAEIEGLRDIFQICVENDLMLYASY